MVKLEKELGRLGLTVDKGFGVFVLDLAAWFPYGHQDKLRLCASLSEGPFGDGPVHPLSLMCVQSHRYPNKGWVCMTGRHGRKLCKCGCVAVLRHGGLSGFHYLNVGYSVEGRKSCAFSVPIDIHTSDDEPCVSLRVQLGLEDPYGYDPVLVAIVDEMDPVQGRKPRVYSTRAYDTLTKDALGGYGDDRLIVLTFSCDGAMGLGRVLCNETIRVFPQSLGDALPEKG